MIRTSKIVYADDEGRELLTLKDGKADIVSRITYAGLDADTLDQLAMACAAAAEELRATAEKEVVA